MPVDWRRLLDEIGVEWRDRGRNVGRNRVNVPCPWCGDDPSHHLSISLQQDSYYCFRDPRHQGRDPRRLLTKLGVDYRDATRLLNDYNVDLPPAEAQAPKVLPDMQRQWDRFLPAEDSQRCVAYLSERGFATPRTVASRYGLRWSSSGKWAKRLLFPFREDTYLVTWSGRALVPQLEPKYDMPEGSPPGAVYLPRGLRPTLVMAEGPIDALKIAVATEDDDVSALAIAGKALGNDKLARLKQLVGGQCDLVLFMFDDDVSTSFIRQAVSLMRSVLPHSTVGHLRLPVGVHDAGEMNAQELRQWIMQAVLP